MFIVPITPQGHIEWKAVLEVSSLQDWVKEQNRKTGETKSDHQYGLISPLSAKHSDGQGRVIEIYHACEKDPFRLT